MLVLTDVSVLLLAMTAAGSWSLAGWTYAGAILLALSASGHYQPRISLHALPELPRLVGRLAVSVLALLPFGLVALEQTVLRQVAVTMVALCSTRALAYAGIRLARRKGRLREATLIVGAGTVAVELARLMKEHPEYGLEPVGFADGPSENGNLPLPHLGSVAQLRAVLRKFEIHRVVVAFGRVREADWVSIMRVAVVNGVEIHVVPRFFDVGMAATGGHADQIWGIPLCRVRSSVQHSVAWRAKRIFDLGCAGLLLAISSPLLALIAVAVRFSSPGPILFRQPRIGQHGREFELLKFRSMRIEHDGTTCWRASEEDQTAVGRWLRRTSLDELPQLWNIVRGDMSLVGPRPERPNFAMRFSADIPGYDDRHRIPVGLTGWAQVHGLRGDNTSLQERARFDNLYIEDWSLWLDIVTLLRTVGAVIRMALRSPMRVPLADASIGSDDRAYHTTRTDQPMAPLGGRVLD